MIKLEAKSDGVLVPVTVQPGARRNGVVGFHDGSVKIAVNAAPERGKANQAVIEVLAEVLDIPRSNISLNSGPTSRKKTFLISGVTVEVIVSRLSF